MRERRRPSRGPPSCRRVSPREVRPRGCREQWRRGASRARRRHARLQSRLCQKCAGDFYPYTCREVLDRRCPPGCPRGWLGGAGFGAPPGLPRVGWGASFGAVADSRRSTAAEVAVPLSAGGERALRISPPQVPTSFEYARLSPAPGRPLRSGLPASHSVPLLALGPQPAPVQDERRAAPPRERRPRGPGRPLGAAAESALHARPTPRTRQLVYPALGRYERPVISLGPDQHRKGEGGASARLAAAALRAPVPPFAGARLLGDTPFAHSLSAPKTLRPAAEHPWFGSGHCRPGRGRGRDEDARGVEAVAGL